MVQWVIENHNADPARVFVGGASSGACMTAALVATHPDVFAAGVMMAGVPYGAWTGGGSCGVCNQGASAKTEQQWGDIVRMNAPEGFAGPWPRLQVRHGSADTTLNYGWATETEKQWKDLQRLTGSGMAVTGPSGWERAEYASGTEVVLGINRGAGKDHYLPDDIRQAEMIAFFGPDQDPPPSGTGGAPSTGGAASGGGDVGGTSAGGAATGGSSNGGTMAGGSVNGSGGESVGTGGAGGGIGAGTASGGFASGGTVATGGALGSGGAAAVGGTLGAAGGAFASGGAGATPGGGGTSGGGCTVGVPGGAPLRGFASLLVAAGFALLSRRRRRVN